MVTQTYTAQFKAASKPASKLKSTIVEDVVAKPTAASIDDDIKDLFAKYEVNVPSGVRVVVSYVTAFCIGLGVGYIGGMLLEFLVVSALTFTSSVFLAMAIYVLGIVAMIYGSYKLGGWVGHYIMSGDIDRSYEKCSNVVRGFFSFGKCEVTS